METAEKVKAITVNVNNRPVTPVPVLDALLTLICEQLQISDTQQRQAEVRYEAIGRVLEMPRSPLAPHGPSLYPQGSLRIGTTVKPLGRKEFDLDIVCEVKADLRLIPDPPVLINSIATYLNGLPAYVGSVRRKNRCVRVRFADQFHMDVLPACPDPRNGGTHLLVPDRESGGWKPSNPKGYAAWFESRSEFVRKLLAERAEPIPPKEPVEIKPTLKLATQLMKRWRDVRFADLRELAPISIVLTTLAGTHCGGHASLAVALLNILEGIVAHIPPQGRLIVLNPVNPEEDLSERWSQDPEAYASFVSGIRSFLQGVQKLFMQRPLDGLCKELGKLFGEDVSKFVVKLHAEALERNRTNNDLHVRKHSGVLVGAGGAATVVPVRPHTFYGS